MFEKELINLVSQIGMEDLEFKEYGRKGKKMATTHAISVISPAAKVPGVDGQVGRLQITFCANWLDISDEATYRAKTQANADNVLAALPEDVRNQLLEKYVK
jgi:hypothetical protein